MSRLLILGAGGHGKVVAETALANNKFQRISFLDDGKIGEKVLGIEVIDGLSTMEKLRGKFDSAFVALGDNKLRVEWLLKLKKIGFFLPIIKHPTSVISKSAVLKEGTCVFANAVINANAKIGFGCIINTSSVVEHDCKIEDGVHVSCNVSLGGTTCVGKHSLLGIGSTVINNISIGENVIIGAGAVVTKNIPPNCIAVGVPAKPIKF